MIKEDYLAIVLQKWDVGESDRYYTFFTRENGLMRVVARGVRKPGARLAPHLEDYVMSRLTVARNYGPGILAGAYTENGHTHLRQNYDMMCALARARRIVLSLLHTEQKDEALFLIISDFFDLMDEQLGQSDKDAFFVSHNDSALSATDMLLIEVFLMKIFDYLGYHFPLTHCVRCACKLPEARNFFTPFEGGFLCQDCVRSGNITQCVACDPSTLKVLRLVEKNSLGSFVKVRLEGRVVAQMQIITDLIARWIMR